MTGRQVKDEKEVLQAVAQVASELSFDFMVVGAGARDLLLEAGGFTIRARRTFDVDIAVRVKDWDEYGRLFARLQEGYGCRPDPRFRGRLLFPDAPSMDLVPFGAIADADGNISWPPDHDVEMGTAGFDAVLAAAVSIRVGEAAVKVATFASIVLLKLLAWHDRADRTDDLRDIWFIFDSYTDLIPESRLYGENAMDADILDGNDGFDWTAAGARLAGRDVVRETGVTGIRLLDWLDPELPIFQDRFIRALTAVEHCSAQQAIDTLRFFRRGMDEMHAGHRGK